MKSKQNNIAGLQSSNFEFSPEDLIFSTDLADVTSERASLYAIHVICNEGSCSFKMSGKNFEINKGDLVIWTHGKLVSDINETDDFDVIVLYVSYRFVRKNAPNNDYDIIGNLSLLQNPILPLSENDRIICLNDLDLIKSRLKNSNHKFYHELLGCLVIAFFLDLYDIHARLNSNTPVSEQNARLLRDFIELLGTGDYVIYREVAYYASKLAVTPKYLSEVCKKVSGHSATFWIDRFTITEITRKLRNKQQTLTEIADQMNFSSISYFSRYVQRTLGLSPTEFRQRLD